MSQFDDLRKRLEALNRGPLDAGGRDDKALDALRKRIRDARDAPADAKAHDKGPALIAHRRNLPKTQGVAAEQALPGEPVSIETAGGEQFEARGTAALRIVQKVGEMGETWPLLAQAYRDAMGREDSPLRVRLRGRFELPGLLAEDVIFMDTETTGLGSSPVFLIGVMAWEDDDLVIRQLFARNYAEERAIVSEFLDFSTGRKLLVTFNGKSFDVPYIRARCVTNGITFRLAMDHFDLLHESRRIWGRQLPNCKLQTLETLVCGRRRHGDIPGNAIPDAYHYFVRTGDARQMLDVLKHNTFDLLTLADLLTRFSALKPPKDDW